MMHWKQKKKSHNRIAFAKDEKVAHRIHTSLTQVSIQHLPQHLIQRLMRQLHAQERRRIRRHRPRHRRRNAREKRTQTASAVKLPDRTADSRVSLRALQAALDRVDRENGDPHRHARRAASSHDGRDAQLAGLAVRVLGRESALDRLVRCEIGRGAGPVARQRHHRPAVDGANAAFLVQLADHVHAAGVFGLLAGCEGLLPLDLEEHFYALEGCGDERHRDGGEEACGAHLAHAVLLVFYGAEGFDELFADAVALGELLVCVARWGVSVD